MRTRSPAVVMEPVLENIGIVLPDAGYLAAVREACDRHGVLLVFDEVKTGLTAGYGGASRRLGVTPDLVTLAKSIGGGLPLAAFGGREEVMAAVTDGRMAALRHLQRQPAGDGRCGRRRRGLHRGGARGGRVRQRGRAARHRRGHRRVRAAGPHRRLRRQGRGHLVDHAGPQLPRLQAHRLRRRRAELAVGRQPPHPHPARARRAVARVARAHPGGHGDPGRGLQRAGAALRA